MGHERKWPKADKRHTCICACRRHCVKYWSACTLRRAGMQQGQFHGALKYFLNVQMCALYAFVTAFAGAEATKEVGCGLAPLRRHRSPRRLESNSGAARNVDSCTEATGELAPAVNMPPSCLELCSMYVSVALAVARTAGVFTSCDYFVSGAGYPASAVLKWALVILWNVQYMSSVVTHQSSPVLGLNAGSGHRLRALLTL
eukprot:6213590-Pleurochrysis_carterae.AAC.2